MTPENVQAMVQQVRTHSGDSEAAHGYEDACWRETLQAIADRTATDPAGCAAAALQTGSIEFDRWYA